jgi:hypothetical protein
MRAPERHALGSSTCSTRQRMSSQLGDVLSAGTLISLSGRCVHEGIGLWPWLFGFAHLTATA